MPDAVLVLNAGSSSIKFGLFDIERTEPHLKFKGLLDEQAKAPRIVVTEASGKELFEKRRPAGEAESNGLFIDIFTKNVSKDWVVILQAIIILFVACEAIFRMGSRRLLPAGGE